MNNVPIKSADGLKDAAVVLREYGAAMRGDWGNIDGRAVRGDLEDIAGWIDNPVAFPGLLAAREQVGICRSGGGHWIDYCTEEECEADR